MTLREYFLTVPKSEGTRVATQEARKSSPVESRSKLERSSWIPSNIPRAVSESLLIFIFCQRRNLAKGQRPTMTDILLKRIWLRSRIFHSLRPPTSEGSH
ncbi:hypothetical protein CDAR_193561 [Caerostris darwini]|uniref:Uncharacterized protein n=1 Tax=Caerostris darwini TaxID=1538125 RepID=A0AAV4RLE0_9ARAC|nr:hypothetical protein CDAR_193561 [Caerostris darwini]